MAKNSNTVESLEQIKTRLREFAAERDWDQFHSPKNLAMALIVEAAELVEHFQWLTEEQSQTLPPDKLAENKQIPCRSGLYPRIAPTPNKALQKATAPPDYLQ